MVISCTRNNATFWPFTGRGTILQCSVIHSTVVDSIIQSQLLESAKFPPTAMLNRIAPHFWLTSNWLWHIKDCEKELNVVLKLLTYIRHRFIQTKQGGRMLLMWDYVVNLDMTKEKKQKILLKLWKSFPLWRYWSQEENELWVSPSKCQELWQSLHLSFIWSCLFPRDHQRNSFTKRSYLSDLIQFQRTVLLWRMISGLR